MDVRAKSQGIPYSHQETCDTKEVIVTSTVSHIEPLPQNYIGSCIGQRPWVGSAALCMDLESMMLLRILNP